MKVAICISGQTRNYSKYYELFQRNVLGVVPNSDIYISTWADESTNQVKFLFNPKQIEVEQYNPNQLINYNKFSQFSKQFQNDSNAIPENQVPMYYKVWKCNELVKQSGIEYDLIIRTRFDHIYATPLDLHQLYEATRSRKTIYTYIDPFPQYPGWLYDGLAVGVPEVMNVYSNLYLDLYDQALGTNDWVSHAILRDYMIKYKIKPKNLNSIIGVTRKDKDILYFLQLFNQDMCEQAWKTIN